MTPQQEKAFNVFNTIAGIAETLVGIHRKAIPNSRLLHKRLFGKSTLPHPKKRALKRAAQAEANNRVGKSALTVLLGASQVYHLAEQPMPKYPSGTI